MAAYAENAGMVIDVNVLTVEPTDNSLDITVSVNTSSRSLTTEYEVAITDSATGGRRTLRGNLDGTAGFGPGDEVIHEVSFGLNPPASGTVTAEITSPSEYAGAQDQQDWKTESAGLNVNECGVNPTSGGDLEVTYTLTPSLAAQGETYEISIRVNGQRVGSTTHEIPNRTITRTQTIPADNLPTGSNMPVEIGVGGDFSECGTVTVEEDEPAPEPPDDPTPEPPEEPAPTPSEALEVENCLFPPEVQPGEQVDATVAVTNTASELVEADMRVEMKAGENQVYPLWLEGIRVPAGSTEFVSGTAEASTFAPNGEYDIVVTFDQSS